MEKLINRFMAGASINIWRNSSPHNLWLEDGEGTEELSGAEFMELRKLAQHHLKSHKTVSYGSFVFAGRDRGQPIMESFFISEPTGMQRQRINNA